MNIWNQWPHLESFSGRLAWLHPHRRDLYSDWSTRFCIDNTGIWTVDDDTDDRCTELLCRIENDKWPETETINNQYQVSLSENLG